MIFGESTATVEATPAAVLDLVWDLSRYRLADHKIRRVLSVTPDGNDLVVRFRSRLRGLPTPAVRQRVVRSGDERIDITSVRSWRDRIVGFRGYITATATPDGTRVVHREEFHPHGPLRPIIEAFLGSWLVRDIEDEVRRLSRLVDEPATAPSAP